MHLSTFTTISWSWNLLTRLSAIYEDFSRWILPIGVAGCCDENCWMCWVISAPDLHVVINESVLHGRRQSSFPCDLACSLPKPHSLSSARTVKMEQYFPRSPKNQTKTNQNKQETKKPSGVILWGRKKETNLYLGLQTRKGNPTQLMCLSEEDQGRWYFLSLKPHWRKKFGWYGLLSDWLTFFTQYCEMG